MKLVKNNKIILTSAGVFLLLNLFIGFDAVSANADTISNSPCKYEWVRNLKIGNTGDDVLKLQQFLNADSDTVVTLTGIGSPGKEVMYYGVLTRQAVIKFQEKYRTDILIPAGLQQGTGFVGIGTRAKLNALCSAQFPSASDKKSATTTTTEADILTVSKPDQPAQTLAPQNAGGVAFTNLTLTAGGKDVTVNKLSIESVGPGSASVFYSVALNDADGNPIGLAGRFNSNHKVELGEPFVIPAHTSKTLTIVGNMESDLSGHAGESPILQVNAINASTGISGTLPIKGTGQVVNDTLAIGTGYTSLSSFDPASLTTHYINDTGVRFSGIRITADSKEDLTLYSIGWDQAGSAGSNDVKNVVIVVNDTPYSVEVNGRLFTAIFNPGIVIQKGQSIDVYIQGDLMPSGVSRTVRFDINSSDNIALMGNSYGFYVLILPESNTATAGNSVFITTDGTTDGDSGSPFFKGSAVTVSGGTFTGVGKSVAQ